MLSGMRVLIVVVAALLPGASSFTPTSRVPAQFIHSMLQTTPNTLQRSAVPSMGLMDVVKRLLYGDAGKREPATAGAGGRARNRLQVVLAADRTGLDELTMNKIRAEIKLVIEKFATCPSA